MKYGKIVDATKGNDNFKGKLNLNKLGSCRRESGLDNSRWCFFQWPAEGRADGGDGGYDVGGRCKT